MLTGSKCQIGPFCLPLPSSRYASKSAIVAHPASTYSRFEDEAYDISGASLQDAYYSIVGAVAGGGGVGAKEGRCEENNQDQGSACPVMSTS